MIRVGDTIKSAARMVQITLPEQLRAEREPTGHHSFSAPISKALPLTVSRNARSGAVAESRQEAFQV